MRDVASREDMDKKPVVVANEAGSTGSNGGSGGGGQQDKARKAALPIKVLRLRWII